MSTEVAGPVSTHPQLLPEGGHSSVGGRGITGSADSLQVGVTTLGYPSGLADPLDSTSVSAVEGQISAATATSTLSTSISQLTARQPPTTAEVTAAASRSPTIKQSSRGQQTLPNPKSPSVHNTIKHYRA